MRSLLALPLVLMAWPASHLRDFMDDVDGAWDVDDPLLSADGDCGPTWPR